MIPSFFESEREYRKRREQIEQDFAITLALLLERSKHPERFGETIDKFLNFIGALK